MATIAKLKSEQNKNGAEELFGELRTLQMSLNVRFVPITKKIYAKGPDYQIMGGTWDDRAVQIGSAWKQQKTHADGTVFEFLSVTIDDPSLPHPLNVAGFRNEDGDWELSWRRRQPKQATA